MSAPTDSVVVVTNGRSAYEVPAPKWWEFLARFFMLHPYGPPVHGPYRMAIASAAHLFLLVLVVDTIGWSNLFWLVAASAGVPFAPQLAVVLGSGFAWGTVQYERAFFAADPSPESGSRRRLVAAAVGRVAVIVGVTYVLALALELLACGGEVYRRHVEQFLNPLRYEALLVNDRVADALKSHKTDLGEAQEEQLRVVAGRATTQSEFASAELDGRRARDTRLQATQGAARAEGSARYWELEATTLTDEPQRAGAGKLGRRYRAEAKRLRALAAGEAAREDAATARADKARAQLTLAEDRLKRASGDVTTFARRVEATGDELQKEWRRVLDEVTRIESGGDPRAVVVNGKAFALRAMTLQDRLAILRDLSAAEPPRWPTDVPETGKRRAMELFGRDTDEAAVSARLEDRADVMNDLRLSLRGITIVLPLLVLLMKFLGGTGQYYSVSYQCALGHPEAIRHRAALRRARGIVSDEALAGELADEFVDATPVHLAAVTEGPDEAATADSDAVAAPAAAPSSGARDSAEPASSDGQANQVKLAEPEPSGSSHNAKSPSRSAGAPTNGAARRQSRQEA